MSESPFPLPDHVLYEMIPVGNSLRINAACPKTLVEVTVFGPLNAVELLKRTARRKLGYAIAKQGRTPGTQSGWTL